MKAELRFLRRTTDRPRRRFQRGVYILPTLFTLGNMFCGYSCIVYAMRGEFETAACWRGLSPAKCIREGFPILYALIHLRPQISHAALPICSRGHAGDTK